jgi:hypothetical protein
MGMVVVAAFAAPMIWFSKATITSTCSWTEGLGCRVGSRFIEQVAPVEDEVVTHFSPDDA